MFRVPAKKCSTVRSARDNYNVKPEACRLPLSFFPSFYFTGRSACTAAALRGAKLARTVDQASNFYARDASRIAIYLIQSISPANRAVKRFYCRGGENAIEWAQNDTKIGGSSLDENLPSELIIINIIS